MSTPALDPRWPSPGLAIVFYTLILFPSVAILAIYAPLLSPIGAGSHHKSTGGATKGAAEGAARRGSEFVLVTPS